MARRDPVILSASRTPIGRFLGAFAGISAVELGVIAAKSALSGSLLPLVAIDEAIVGNVLSTGLGQAPARQVALGAGLPSSVSALAINMVCGSGLRAVMLAEAAIRAGESRAILAGGIESMSRAPHFLPGARLGAKLGDLRLVDSMTADGLTCSFSESSMGILAEGTARKFGLTRHELDDYSRESHRKAVAAQTARAFEGEITPVTIDSPKGSRLVSEDEGPRPDTTLDTLGRLKPAFDPGGIITPGNSSMLSDGASMLVVASEDAARLSGGAPLATIRASAVSGGPPAELFEAPIAAVRAVCRKAGVALEDVDLFEINEAFAAQAIACIRGLEIDPSRVNILGGAIAIGHPIGASGARVLTTLIHALARSGKNVGVASLCLGGGNAVAMLVERSG